MNVFHEFIERFVAVRAHVLVHNNKINRVFFCVIFNAIGNKPNLYFKIV